METLWNRNGGIYLGYGSSQSQGNPPPVDRPIRYVGDRHLVTIGPNGSGKSRRLLLPNLVDLTGWSSLVVDVKGDLAIMTGRHRAASGNRVFLLNPFNALNLGSHGFNPIAALDPSHEDFPDDAMGLAEALIRIEGREPHWGHSAQDLICALIMYVRIVLPDPSLADVRALLGQDSAALRDTVLGRTITYRDVTVPGMVAAGILYDCPELEVKASRFGDIGPDNRELSSVISTALTQTRWLDSRPVKADLAKGGLDFGKMKSEPTTVYLILPARRLGTHSTWLRLMITCALQPLMKDTRRSAVPVMLMLDEFAQLGHLPVIEQTLALMRGFGVKLWAVLQDLSQITDIYGQRWESFLGNAGVLQSFAPQDVVTAEYLSKRAGQTTIAPKGASIQDHQAHVSVGQVAVPLMLPQDLRNMDSGFSVLFSDKLKGPAISYFPYPSDLPRYRAVCALDPST